MPPRPRATATTTESESLWLEGPPGARRAALQGEARADVAVIGGGMAGTCIAAALARDGADVVLLEAGQIAGGVTGANTAKVTALQGTVLRTISRTHGAERVRAYAQGSRAGVELVASLASEYDLSCDLHRRPAFTYATDEKGLQMVEQEAQAAIDAGLPAAVVGDPDLPYPTHGAVRLESQLEFHPVRFARGLIDALEAQGRLRVYEGTRVTGVTEGAPCQVITDGGSVRAERVVVATHYPLLDRGLFFAILETVRSYAIALEIEDDPPQGMSISAGGGPTRSLRSYGRLLIVGGEDHAVGSEKATPERFDALEKFAREHWDVKQVRHRWSAHDAIAYDQLPLIGPYRPGSSKLYVASGFMKWGLSGGAMAAIVLADLLAGRGNDWAETFAPHRLSLRALPRLAKLGAKVSADLLGDRVKPAEGSDASEVAPGEGRIMRSGLGKTAVYREPGGQLHAVSARCTHLGCLLRFNSAEVSWDCPCHGSRFDVDGAVLEGPALKPLDNREPPGQGSHAGSKPTG